MLTKRQELILKMIIKDFTNAHSPVGSKTIQQQLPVKVSSATIRNEMAVLEDYGMIEKTHSSSGRVPSAKGYRYYLDHLVEPIAISDDVYRKIMVNFSQPFNQVDEIVREAAKILSDLTSYTALAAGPEFHDVKVTGFRIVPLSNHQVMAILVTSDGNVKSQVYALTNQVNGEEIEKAVRMINDQLVGKSVLDVTQMTLPDLTRTIDNDDNSASALFDLMQDIFKDAASEQLYVNGQINLLNDYDSDDVDQLKSLYKLMNQHHTLADMLSDDQDFNSNMPVHVRLGSELPSDLLKNYSLLTASYDIGDHGKGMIALLGPTNMPYSQMISLMGYFRNELAKKMLDYYNKFK